VRRLPNEHDLDAGARAGCRGGGWLTANHQQAVLPIGDDAALMS
jgi:hypothetical protein